MNFLNPFSVSTIKRAGQGIMRGFGALTANGDNSGWSGQYPGPRSPANPTQAGSLYPDPRPPSMGRADQYGVESPMDRNGEPQNGPAWGSQHRGPHEPGQGVHPGGTTSPWIGGPAATNGVSFGQYDPARGVDPGTTGGVPVGPTGIMGGLGGVAGGPIPFWQRYKQYKAAGGTGALPPSMQWRRGWPTQPITGTPPGGTGTPFSPTPWVPMNQGPVTNPTRIDLTPPPAPVPAPRQSPWQAMPRTGAQRVGGLIGGYGR